MENEKLEQADAGSEGAETRRVWVRPHVQNILTGAAELSGGNNADGDAGVS
jgi:hypothetical protein